MFYRFLKYFFTPRSFYMLSINANLWTETCLNGTKAVCPFFVSVGTAHLINKIGHSIFRCNDGGYASKTIKCVSVIAGTATGIYTSSFLPFHVITAKAALDATFFNITLLAITKLAFHILGHQYQENILVNSVHTFACSLLGSAIGLGGQYSSAVISAFGSLKAIGVSIAPKEKTLSFLEKILPKIVFEQFKVA
jgi:hypothetical protein